MAITRGLGVTGNGAGVVTPLDHKLAQAGLVAKRGAGSNLVRSGVFFDTTVNLVTGRANMAYDVAAFTAVLSRGAAAGAVLLSNDGTVSVSTTPAPGSNSRIDIVYAWQREFSLDGVDSNPVIGVVQGTAAASPVAPSLAAFPGAIELARITVPAGITATTSATITQTSRFTAAAGGVVYFRNVTERDEALNLVPDGTIGFVETTDTLWYHADGAWAPLQVNTRTIVKRTAGTLGTNTSFATLSMGTPVTGSDFTEAAGVFTCQRAGEYRVKLNLSFGGNATGTRGVRLLGSGGLGARQLQQNAVGSLDFLLGIEWILTLAQNDTLSTQAQQNSGGSLTVLGDILFERVA